ncbi:unnamed protein product [Chrysoparadoxa australica]
MSAGSGIPAGIQPPKDWMMDDTSALEIHDHLSAIMGLQEICMLEAAFLPGVTPMELNGIDLRAQAELSMQHQRQAAQAALGVVPDLRGRHRTAAEIRLELEEAKVEARFQRDIMAAADLSSVGAGLKLELKNAAWTKAHQETLSKMEEQLSLQSANMYCPINPADLPHHPLRDTKHPCKDFYNMNAAHSWSFDQSFSVLRDNRHQTMRAAYHKPFIGNNIVAVPTSHTAPGVAMKYCLAFTGLQASTSVQQQEVDRAIGTTAYVGDTQALSEEHFLAAVGNQLQVFPIPSVATGWDGVSDTKGKNLGHLSAPIREIAVKQSHISPTTVACGGYDGAISIIDIQESLVASSKVQAANIGGAMSSVRFNPHHDSQISWTGDAGSISFSDIRTNMQGANVKSFKMPSGVYTHCYHPLSPMLAVPYKDNEISWWDFRVLTKPLAVSRDPILGMIGDAQACPHTGHIAFFGMSGVSLWNMKPTESNSNLYTRSFCSGLKQAMHTSQSQSSCAGVFFLLKGQPALAVTQSDSAMLQIFSAGDGGKPNAVTRMRVLRHQIHQEEARETAHLDQEEKRDTWLAQEGQMRKKKLRPDKGEIIKASSLLGPSVSKQTTRQDTPTDATDATEAIKPTGATDTTEATKTTAAGDSGMADALPGAEEGICGPEATDEIHQLRASGDQPKPQPQAGA